MRPLVIVELDVGLNRNLGFRKTVVLLHPDFLFLQRPEKAFNVAVCIRIVIPSTLVVYLTILHRLNKPSTCHLASIVCPECEMCTLDTVWKTAIESIIHSLQELIRTAIAGE